MLSAPLRLGFAVKVLGQPGLKSNDSRRWQNKPHLRVSLEYLRAIFDYLRSRRITMYRISSDLAPYVTHPDMPQFHGQIRECARELEQMGRLARQLDLRLSFHPSQYVVLNSPDRTLVEKSARDLAAQSEMLDRMGLGPEAVVVIHTGAAYGARSEGRRLWVRNFKRLPAHVRRRLVLENDDQRFSAADVLAIHEETGVRLVFDFQHFWCYNPERLELAATLRRFLASWSDRVRPKVHYSSPRTEMREVKRRNRQTGKQETVLQAPVWIGHADFVNPFEFIQTLRLLGPPAFDVMLEAKAKDLALLRLRRDLATYGEDLAPHFGISPEREAGQPLPLEAIPAGEALVEA
ncbi:MAG: UV DNA damage repair endonuclease UvsE [Bryobacteraceae bacterium]